MVKQRTPQLFSEIYCLVEIVFKKHCLQPILSHLLLIRKRNKRETLGLMCFKCKVTPKQQGICTTILQCLDSKV